MIPTAIVHTTPAWVSLCGKLAPMASIALCLAPLPTIRRVSRDRSVGNLPLLPHTTMVSNAYIWTIYGVLRNEPSVWVANSIGLGLSTIYFKVFSKYAPYSSPTLPGSVSTHVQACLTTMMTTMSLAAFLPRQKAAAMIGNMGVLFCMFLFASPLVAMKTVVQEKSAESIPLPFTLAAVTCCFLWAVVGLLKMKDFVIYFPNLVGLSFGLAQLALKILYGNGPAVEMAPEYAI